MLSLQIVADENIPFLDEAFGGLGSIEQCAGDAIGPDVVDEADVLLIRSVTPVGPSLLAESSVQFVGSATTGTDHVDRAYLDEQGIPFAHAPGSNADSVADYVVAVLLSLARSTGKRLRGQTVGIIGCGNIGGRLARRLPALGLSVLRNDPPKAEAAEAAGKTHDFAALETVLQRADVVTLHVPLTTDSSYPTHHLIDETALSQLGKGAWLLNTSRGPVVDNDALLEALQDGRVGAAGLDVWEGEPLPNEALVRAVDVATPHIAGYAFDGKVRGTRMIYEALCDELDIEPSWNPEAALRPDDPDDLRCRPPDPRLPMIDWLHDLVRQAYDIGADDARMRGYLDQAPEDRSDYFRHLRATYPTRREFQQHTMPWTGVPDTFAEAVEDGVTMERR